MNIINITTEEARAMIADRDSPYKFQTICRLAGLNYITIWRRLRRGGQLKGDEGERLGKALAKTLPKALAKGKGGKNDG